MIPDPDPNGRQRSAWRTYRRCLEEIPPDRPAVILQDDTVACPGFAKAAKLAMEARPGRLITFFSRDTPNPIERLRQLALEGCQPFIEFPRGFWIPTVALAWPAGFPGEFLEWVDAKKRPILPDKITDDPVVGEWATETKRGALASVPSLVEHPDDVPSYLRSHKGHGKGYRTAACWIGDTPIRDWLALL